MTLRQLKRLEMVKEKEWDKYMGNIFFNSPDLYVFFAIEHEYAMADFLKRK